MIVVKPAKNLTTCWYLLGAMFLKADDAVIIVPNGTVGANGVIIANQKVQVSTISYVQAISSGSISIGTTAVIASRLTVLQAGGATTSPIVVVSTDTTIQFEINSSSSVFGSSVNIKTGSNILFNSFALFMATTSGANCDGCHIAFGTGTVAAGATLTITPTFCGTLVIPIPPGIYNSAAVAAGSLELGAFVFSNSSFTIINRDATDAKNLIWFALCK